MAAIQGDWYASAGASNKAYPERDGTVRFVYADQPNGERYIVAKVWADDDGDYEGTALLVAAAPKMLQALKDIAEECERRLTKGEDSGDRATLRLCRDAISNAERRRVAADVVGVHHTRLSAETTI